MRALPLIRTAALLRIIAVPTQCGVAGGQDALLLALSWFAFRQGLTRRQVAGMALILLGGAALLRLQG